LGNVRELKNLMERLCIFAGGREITLSDLPNYILGKEKEICPPTEKIEDCIPIEIKPLKEFREEAEKRLIEKSLEIYHHNLKEVAKALKVDLSSLYRKMKQYQLGD